MKRNKVFSLIAFLLILVSIVLLPSYNVNAVFAQSETIENTVNIQLSQEGNYYIVSAYVNSEFVENVFFVVNEITIVPLEYEVYSIMLEKSDKAMEIYAVARIFGENDNIYESKSTILIIKPNNAQSEEGAIATTTIILGGIVPVVLAIGSVVLLLYLCFKKKSKPMNRVITNLNEYNGLIENIVQTIKNENLKQKKKDRLFKSSLNNLYKDISKNINIVIALNIESLGQYNSLLSNLIKFENMIKALSICSINKDEKYKIKYLNQIKKYTLPIIITNAKEIEKTCMIAENSKNSLFVQHTKSSQGLDNEESCEKYLSKTLYLNIDEDEQKQDGEQEE